MTKSEVTMYFKLNYASHLPLSAQIAYFLKKAIKEGSFNHTNQLPSIKEVSEGLCLAPAIVKEAYQMLIESSLIEKRKSTGYFLIRSRDLENKSIPTVFTTI